MDLIKMQCVKCLAITKVDRSKTQVKCPYCGTLNRVAPKPSSAMSCRNVARCVSADATVPMRKIMVADASATMFKRKNTVADVSATVPKHKNMIADASVTMPAYRNTVVEASATYQNSITFT